MCATAAAIYINPIPVFADINEYDCNISQDVEAKITDQPAIMAVDIFGSNSVSDQLLQVAKV